MISENSRSRGVGNLTVLYFFEARLHIATEVNHFKGRINSEELSLPPKGSRSDNSTVG